MYNSLQKCSLYKGSLTISGSSGSECIFKKKQGEEQYCACSADQDTGGRVFLETRLMIGCRNVDRDILKVTRGGNAI